MAGAILVLLAVVIVTALAVAVQFARRRLGQRFERWVEDGGWSYQTVTGGSWAKVLPAGVGPRITVQVGGIRRWRAVTVAQYVIGAEGPDDLDRRTLDYTVVAVALPGGYRDMARWQWAGPPRGREDRYTLRADEYELSYQLPAAPGPVSSVPGALQPAARSLRGNSPWRVGGGHVVVMCPGPIFGPVADALVHKALDIADMLPAPEAFRAV